MFKGCYKSLVIVINLNKIQFAQIPTVQLLSEFCDALKTCMSLSNVPAWSRCEIINNK